MELQLRNREEKPPVVGLLELSPGGTGREINVGGLEELSLQERGGDSGASFSLGGEDTQEPATSPGASWKSSQ